MAKCRLFGEIIPDETYRWSNDDVTPSQFEAFLRRCESTGEDIEIEINTPGGDIMAGLAIANMIKKSPCNITGTIYGMAASMGSVIACSCDVMQAYKGSFMMIHNPWGYAGFGTADELRKVADTLDAFKAVLLGFYRGIIGRPDEELSALMDDETWISGDEFAAFPVKCTILDAADIQIAACASRVNFSKVPDSAAKMLKHLDKKPDDPGNAVAALTDKLTRTEAARRDWQAKYDRAVKDLDAATQGHIAALDQLRAEHAAALATAQGLHAKAIADLTARYDAQVADNKTIKTQVGDLEDRLAKIALNTLGEPGSTIVATTWAAALEECGGDYAKAAKKYPALAKEYRESKAPDDSKE